MPPELTDWIARRPLVDRLLEFRPRERLLAEADLDPTADPFLWGHCFKGTPFVPAAFVLELFAEAALLLAPDRHATGMVEVEFVNGIRFFTSDPAQLWVEATRQADRVTCEMRSDFRNTKGKLVESDRLCTRAVVELGERAAAAEGLPPLHGPDVPWVDIVYSEDRRNYFGPQMRCLKRVALRPEDGWGQILIPDLGEVGGRRTGDGWVLHPAVFDACLVACDVLTEELFDRRIQLPHTYDLVRVFRLPAPGQTCTVRFHKLGHTAETTHYEWTFYDPAGQPLSLARGYRCHLIDRPAHEHRSLTLGPGAPQLR